jgi:hypothetical protein
MGWFWLNIPLGIVIVLAVSGIPLWLVLKHPDERPSISVAAGDTPAQAGQPSARPPRRATSSYAPHGRATGVVQHAYGPAIRKLPRPNGEQECDVSLGRGGTPRDFPGQSCGPPAR